MWKENIFYNEKEFLAEGTKYIEKNIIKSIEKNNCCILGLSGGKTPVPLYRNLAESKWIDWGKVYIFLVDERYVPLNHDSSNFNMITNNFLLLLNDGSGPVVCSPNTNINNLGKCADDYNQKLNDLFRKRGERKIDLLVMGMGEDQHIASIFPPISNRLMYDSDINCLESFTDKFDVSERITVNLPFLDLSEELVFLLNGSHKYEIYQDMLSKNLDSALSPMLYFQKEKKLTLFIHNPL